MMGRGFRTMSRTSKLALTRSHAPQARTSNLTCSYMPAQMYWFQQGVRFLDSEVPSIQVGRSNQVGSEMRLQHNLVNTCRHTLAQQIILEVVMFSSVLNPVLNGGCQSGDMTAGPQVL